MNVYSIKRCEPRVRLKTKVFIEGRLADGSEFSFETITMDVSPHGASVLVEQALPVGTEVEFVAARYTFRAQAIVRSVTIDRDSGGAVLGLQYPDGFRNPLVIWSAVERDDEARGAKKRSGDLKPVERPTGQ